MDSSALYSKDFLTLVTPERIPNNATVKLPAAQTVCVTVAPFDKDTDDSICLVSG